MICAAAGCASANESATASATAQMSFFFIVTSSYRCYAIVEPDAKLCPLRRPHRAGRGGAATPPATSRESARRGCRTAGELLAAGRAEKAQRDRAETELEEPLPKRAAVVVLALGDRVRDQLDLPRRQAQGR